MTGIIALSVADRATGIFHLCLETEFVPQRFVPILLNAEPPGRFDAGRYAAKLVVGFSLDRVPVRLLRDWRELPGFDLRALVTHAQGTLSIVLLEGRDADTLCLYQGPVTELHLT
ncbi:hypothetical protein GCM10011497_14960 [Elstera cyanobacteriorum]|uniref:Uncharacterized protein n=1 Tax=Elstera cyanobacteriorum TaxID=2022747 RepID=A0A255XL74_9PROT|nr:hypothetical protein [Elstera cyanobacteriorum]OYQ17723.1 hypothetical protein CHR90_12105 [Elstera cyanobacteriorum]GFZ86693.1 hypothetical protein GCM10011497_14960 [Elstera cyanobacteriorum]